MAAMLWTIAGVPLFLCLLGWVGTHTIGSWMHLFVVLAVILAIAGMAQRSRSA